MLRYASITIVALTATMGATQTQKATVGEARFANSGSGAAQAPFLQGLAQLHNFEYDAAADLFQQAQRLDPGFAMAYWGEAMTYNHPIWMEQDREKALAALSRLGPTPDARIAKAPTDREKDYLRVLDVLYGEGDKIRRDVAYADAMAALHRKYPDDVDAAAFHALALLGTAHSGRDFATYMRSAGILEPLFPLHPNHPGLAHYLIHSYDDPIHAPLGLRAARAYSKVAPSAAHAQHMCSHIFVALGMWDDVVAANEAAIGVVNEQRAHHGRGPASCGHIAEWLEYGYLQQGRFAEAKKLVVGCHEAVVKMPPVSAQQPAPYPDYTPATSFAGMRARYLFDSEDWTSDVAALRISRGRPVADVISDLIDGYNAARLGKVDDAKQALEQFTRDRDALAPLMKGETEASHRTWLAILEQQLRAMALIAAGQARAAVERLREAAAMEDKMPFDPGPPAIEKPSFELLGETLLKLDDVKEARAAFEKALVRAPDRTTALIGLMRAAEKMGDRRKADEVRARLQSIWHRAERPMLTEAR